MKRDSSGRYYVLARPATVISIYESNGNLTGHIPNSNSRSATIKYAVDIDLSPEGLLYVVDRGANAVEIFKPDGTKVPVNAPTSLAALSNGEFAVTSLISDRLVQIRDQNGKLLRSFGDPSDIAVDTERKSPMEWEKISGDSADGIYFAFTFVSDPTLRKYDRFGYANYETTVPESVIEAASTTRQDRAEFSLNLSHLSLSEQTASSITLGSSRDVKFNAGLGTGLLGGMRYGGGYGRGAMQAGMLQSGTGDSPFSLFGEGPIGGMISGQISDQGPQVQFGLGSISGTRRGGQGRGAGGTSSGGTSTQGAILQFNGAANDEGIDFTNQDLSESFSFNGELAVANGDSGSGPFRSASYQATDAYGGNLAGQNFGQSFGVPNDFAIGSMMNSFTFRSQMPTGGFGNDLHSGSTGADDQHAGSEMPGREGDEHFGHRGRFGAGETGFTASVRLNLGNLGGKLAERPEITAVALDPATHEIWAGIGETLVHFNQSGDPLEIYQLTMTGGTPLKPTAIVVEPERFLIAADPWGIFEFTRPDKPLRTTPRQFDLGPQAAF